MADRAGLSEGFIYRPKPPAAPAANIRVSVPPHNKDVFTRGNETIMFNIPCGKRGQYLNTRMSYLKFELDVTLHNLANSPKAKISEIRGRAEKGGDILAHHDRLHSIHVESDDLAKEAAHVLALDGGAHSLFSSLEVYHGTNLLEQIREYSTIYQLMLDTAVGSTELNSHYSVGDGMCGTDTTPNGRKGKIITPVYANDITRDVVINKYKPSINAYTPTIRIPATPGANIATNGVAEFTKNSEAIVYESGVAHEYAYEDKHYSMHPVNSPYEGSNIANMSPTPRLVVQHGTTTIPARGAVAAVAYAAATANSPVVYPVPEQAEGPAKNIYTDMHIPSGGFIGGQTQTYTFCIPIMSGILGPQMGKYIPVGSLAADLRLELGIAPFEQAFVSIGGLLHTESKLTDGLGSYTFVNGPRAREAMHKVPINRYQDFAIRNIELELEYVEVASDVQSAIEGSTGGQYVMSFDSFSNFQNAVPADTTAFTQLIGAKFSSVKTAISIFRDANHINRAVRGGITSRVNPFSTRPNRPEVAGNGNLPVMSIPYQSGGGYYYSVGATHYPPKPIQSDQEAYYEALKAQHMVTGTPVGTIDFNNWTISARRDASDADNSASHFFTVCQEGGTFFAAQNFESQSHKSTLAESGLNTLSQNMYLHCRFPPRSHPYGQTVRLVDGQRSVDNGAANATKTCGIYTFTRPEMKNIVAANGLVVKSVADDWSQHNAALQVDHFIHYDAILVIANGICNTRF